jgi:prevent-host-death family protein
LKVDLDAAREVDHPLVQKGRAVEISVTDAKGKLTDLVRRAEAGDDVILTRHGQPTARIVPVAHKPRREDREKLLDALEGAGKQDFGPDAAHASDWLYDDFGLPA